MNTRLSSFFGVVIAVAAVGFLGTAATRSAPPDKTVKTNSPAVENRPIPQSVFTIPNDPKEGRNPFYPNSNPFGTKPSKASPALVFVLNGLSGTPDNKLAIINNQTVAEGEEAETSTSSGRTKFRCIEIKTNSVIIEVGGERRELRLRGDN